MTALPWSLKVTVHEPDEEEPARRPPRTPGRTGVAKQGDRGPLVPPPTVNAGSHGHVDLD
jgi:hypothetical protein